MVLPKQNKTKQKNKKTKNKKQNRTKKQQQQQHDGFLLFLKASSWEPDLWVMLGILR